MGHIDGLKDRAAIRAMESAGLISAREGTDMKNQILIDPNSPPPGSYDPKAGMLTVTLSRKDSSDVRWTGHLLAEVDSDTEARDGGRTNKGRWTRLQLWELESGAWVAAAIGCSDKPGEIDIGDIAVVKATHPSRGKPPNVEHPPVDHAQRRAEVMQFFGWSWLAKKLADQLGWDVVEVIEG